MSNPIKKAIIPVAGKGTRMRPISRVIAKEMLPIGTTPALYYIVKEAALAGIEQILFILSPDKTSVPLFFSDTVAPCTFNETGRTYPYPIADRTIELAYELQVEPYGSGAAVLAAEHFAAGDTVAVLFGDDIMVSDVPVIQQLMDMSSARGGASVLGVQSVSCEILQSCAAVSVGADKRVLSVIEKPTTVVSNSYASLGRFIIGPHTFEALKRVPQHAGELWLTDALHHEAQCTSVYACTFSGERYDIGNPCGYIHAFMSLAPADNQLEYERYLEIINQHHA